MRGTYAHGRDDGRVCCERRTTRCGGGTEHRSDAVVEIRAPRCRRLHAQIAHAADGRTPPSSRGRSVRRRVRRPPVHRPPLGNVAHVRPTNASPSPTATRPTPIKPRTSATRTPPAAPSPQPPTPRGPTVLLTLHLFFFFSCFPLALFSFARFHRLSVFATRRCRARSSRTTLACPTLYTPHTFVCSDGSPKNCFTTILTMTPR